MARRAGGASEKKMSRRETAIPLPSFRTEESFHLGGRREVPCRENRDITLLVALHSSLTWPRSALRLKRSRIAATRSALAREPASRNVLRRPLPPPEDHSGPYFPIVPRSFRTIGARSHFPGSVARYLTVSPALHLVLAREFRAERAEVKFQSALASPQTAPGTATSWSPTWFSPPYSPATSS